MPTKSKSRSAAITAKLYPKMEKETRILIEEIVNICLKKNTKKLQAKDDEKLETINTELNLIRKDVTASTGKSNAYLYINLNYNK